MHSEPQILKLKVDTETLNTEEQTITCKCSRRWTRQASTAHAGP